MFAHTITLSTICLFACRIHLNGNLFSTVAAYQLKLSTAAGDVNLA